jgi:hypothetical protein
VPPRETHARFFKDNQTAAMHTDVV